ncbi:MAG: DUF6666 family protein [Planctomycetaceae bacterium]
MRCLLLAVAFLLQAGNCHAQYFPPDPGYSQQPMYGGEVGFPEQTVEARPWGIQLTDLFPAGDSTLQGMLIEPDERRDWALVGAFGYESFRGVGDRGWQNNGLYAGLNFGTRLGAISDETGIGFQAGFTFGLYDWEGNPYRAETDNRTRQDFASYGLFKRATKESPFTLAVTQDWMITRNSGAWGQSLTLSQLRYRAGYATSASNEFGVIGTNRLVDDQDEDSLGRTYTWQSVNHLSAYWHHKWADGGVNTLITIGKPEKDRLNGDGSLGDFLATATVQCPMSDSVGFFGNIMYMNPTASENEIGALEDAWSLTLGIEIFPGHDARSSTVAGERWSPLLPVANNGVFLLDWRR